ncbi:metal ABC transporter substrate-binding protein [Longivirga aurantiaca]|uniref:Metal ABC transporter substrate-binding protein n=1 Tax=Longivirga aurantiaca TaxID=1837743 RepID=A0ABW1T4T0_9ACTN
MTRRPLRALALLPVVALLAACGSSGAASNGAADPTVSVVAGFYPLQWAAEVVGGDRVSVTSLTSPGAEPHDLELTPQQVAAVTDAGLVLYVAEFQPALDDAIAQSPEAAVDVAAGLETLAPEEHAGEDHEGEKEASYDPHVWLDPTNMAAIVATVAQRLSSLDPAGASTYAANAAALEDRLTALDEQWRTGTATCTSRDLVVSHEAFGYLAKRYGFEQVGISGLAPDTEPSPAKIAEVADFVRANEVRTVYYETLVDPKVAQTVADETGAKTAVLDPLEGLAEGSTDDYISVMEKNLQTVKDGQPCS